MVCERRDSYLKIGHNLKLDALVLAQHGIAMRAIEDVMLMSYVLDAGRRAHDIGSLSETWLDGVGERLAGAYLGTTLPGFPNLFLIVGPNTGLGHNSMVFMMESQFAYILDALRLLEERRLAWVDVRPEIAVEYNRRLQSALADTVWSQGGCRSWYLDREGRNTTLWPGTTWEYRLRLRRFDADAYEQMERP